MKRFAIGLFVVLTTACGASGIDAGPLGDDGGDEIGDDAARGDASSPDAAQGEVAIDAALDAALDSSAPHVDSATLDTASPPDTTPPAKDSGSATRLPCVARGALANDLPLDVPGALEGTLVSIVPPGTGGGCPSDADHLHLQVAVGSKRYDVAVTIFDAPGGAPLGLFTKDLAATSGIAMGWSGTARFDFVSDLGVHSDAFTPLAKPALLTRLETELEGASSVRIFGRSYTDGTGVHDVHRNGGGRDGVILVHGAAADHAIALRFATDVF